MKLSARDRARAVLLLRCAADLALRGFVHAFFDAEKDLDVSRTVYTAAIYYYASAITSERRACIGFFDYHATLLEAAQLLCD